MLIHVNLNTNVRTFEIPCRVRFSSHRLTWPPPQHTAIMFPAGENFNMDTPPSYIVQALDTVSGKHGPTHLVSQDPNVAVVHLVETVHTPSVSA